VKALPFAPEGRLVDAAFSPGASLLATVDAEGTLAVGSPHRAVPSIVRPRSAAAHPPLTFSLDGRTLAYVGADGSVERLDVTRPEVKIGPLRPIGAVPSCLAFAPDGRLLAGGVDGHLVIWDAASGLRRRVSDQADESGIACAAISPDGRLCATGGKDRYTISLWDLDRLRVRARLVDSEGSVQALAFTHDGRTLISAGRGGSIDLWNVATARRMIPLHGYYSWMPSVRGLCVAPDDSSVAAFLVTEPTGEGRGLIWRAARDRGRTTE
jgi:WD40 repeat protein